MMGKSLRAEGAVKSFIYAASTRPHAAGGSR